MGDYSHFKWKVEPCHNPKKAWIQDAKGNRLTVLTSRGMCERIVKHHNQAIALFEVTWK